MLLPYVTSSVVEKRIRIKRELKKCHFERSREVNRSKNKMN